MAAPSISVYVKSLNGEMIHLSLSARASSYDLYREAYEAMPTVPLGCLRLCPFAPDDDPDHEIPHEQALLRLANTLVDTHNDDDSFTLEDGMLVLAVVDDSLVCPSLRLAGDIKYIDTTHDEGDSSVTHGSLVSLTFHRLDEDPYDTPIASLSLVNGPYGKWADLSSFLLIEQSHNRRSLDVYRTRPDIIWYNDLADCILASPVRIPHSESHLQDIFDQYNEELDNRCPRLRR